MPRVSLEACPAIDVHAHPYQPNMEPYTPEAFVRKLSLSVVPQQLPPDHVRLPGEPFPGTNMWVQILIRRMARFYSCAPDLETVVAERNRRATDFAAYTQALFRDARIDGVVADFGYPQPELNREVFAQLCGARLWEVCRIEPVMVRLRQACPHFGEFRERYRAELAMALKRAEVIGLKSIIAYRSGLAIGPMNERAAAEDYPAFQADERASAKALRDYCLHVALEECGRAGKAMHIHTGIGDGDVLLSKASPGLLLDVLRGNRYRETKVHLVHGGYPWAAEAGFLVSVLPHVTLDISLQNPFSGHGVKRILSEVFEFAPFDKVMFGSDAFTVPEMNWLGVHLFKECFEQVLEGWVEEDYMDAETACLIGEMVLYRNFCRHFAKGEEVALG